MKNEINKQIRLLHRPNSQKILDVFGKQKGLEILIQEYRDLSNTELEITKIRWTVYTAFMAVSITLSGLILSQPSLDPILKDAGLVAGLLVNIVSTYFYWWFHRTALMYRDHLAELEKDIGFERYAIRLDRPRIGPIRLRFYWGIAFLLVAHLIGVLVYIIFA